MGLARNHKYGDEVASFIERFQRRRDFLQMILPMIFIARWFDLETGEHFALGRVPMEFNRAASFS